MSDSNAIISDTLADAAESARPALAPEALRALPASFVQQHRVLPLKIQDGTIHIATSNPGNARVIDDIRLLTGLEVEEVADTEAHITARIAECYQVTVEKMIE